MNGKVVGRSLREEVRPLLRAAGFTTFTDRKAWRETEHTIDHVTLRSFNAYNAGVLGCTTYSLTVEVGVFYRCFDPDLARPQDLDCTFRAILGKSIRQPFFATEWGPANDRADVLYVKSDGSNLDEVVDEPQVSFPGNPGSPRWRETAIGIGHLVMDDPRAAMEAAPVLDQD